MVPEWLHVLSIISLVAGFICAAIIIYDETQHPQHMWIMNFVWPAVALFASVVALWGYWTVGRLAMHEIAHPAMEKGETPPHKAQTSFATKVAKGASHCGAGCTLGDICAEWLAFLVPAVAVWLGWHSLFETKMFSVWILDYIFAYVFGIVFQYYSIKPMRDLSVGQGIVQAIKADTLSLTSWQLGMYGFMAIAHFWIFGSLLGAELEVNSFEFWFMMQIAMIFGFMTAYPVNWWLIKSGVKEAM